jgi:hypothetical protein
MHELHDILVYFMNVPPTFISYFGSVVKMRNVTCKKLVSYLKETHPVRQLDVDGRKILKMILNKQGVGWRMD